MKRFSLCVLGVMAVAMAAPAQAQVYEERRIDTDDPISKAVARRSERGYGQGTPRSSSGFGIRRRVRRTTSRLPTLRLKS